jgi:hypothetical protein
MQPPIDATSSNHVAGHQSTSKMFMCSDKVVIKAEDDIQVCTVLFCACLHNHGHMNMRQTSTQTTGKPYAPVLRLLQMQGAMDAIQPGMSGISVFKPVPGVKAAMVKVRCAQSVSCATDSQFAWVCPGNSHA